MLCSTVIRKCNSDWYKQLGNSVTRGCLEVGQISELVDSVIERYLQGIRLFSSLSFSILSSVFIQMLEARWLQQVHMLDLRRTVSVGRGRTSPSLPPFSSFPFSLPLLLLKNDIALSRNPLIDISSLGQNFVICRLLHPVWLSRFGSEYRRSSTTHIPSCESVTFGFWSLWAWGAGQRLENNFLFR